MFMMTILIDVLNHLCSFIIGGLIWAIFFYSASEILFKDANVLIQFRDWFFSQAGNILLALIIFWVGRYAIKWVKAFAVRIMTKASYDSAAMSFITQIINYTLLVGLILICLNQIGVPTTSFVAAFGAFGLGIGLALQSNLSNLASGLLILIFKPFRAGHVIQVGDTIGSVKSVQFMYTIITTKDQKMCIYQTLSLPLKP